MRSVKNKLVRFFRFLKGEGVQDDRTQLKRFFTILGLAVVLGLLLSPLAILATRSNGDGTAISLPTRTTNASSSATASAPSATSTPKIVSGAPVKGMTDNPAYQWWRWPNHAQPDSWWGDGQNAQTLGVQISLMQELGVKLFRPELVWSFVEPTMPGGSTYDSATARDPNWSGYQWSRWDLIVQLASAAGIQLVPQVVYTPDWASGITTTTSKGPNAHPQSPQYYGDFIYAAVTRYKGLIHYWEMWNEPDYAPHTWADFDTTKSLQSYVDYILKPGYQAAKQADPSVQVVMGGLSDSNNASKLYAAGGGAYFDIGNFHAYLPAGGDAAAKDHIRGTMNQNGDKDKPLWMTEFGAQTGSTAVARKADAATLPSDETSQAQLIHDVFSNQNLQAIFLYQLRDTGVYVTGGSLLKMASWGIVSHDYTHRKLGFDTYKQVVGGSLPTFAANISANAPTASAAGPGSTALLLQPEGAFGREQRSGAWSRI